MVYIYMDQMLLPSITAISVLANVGGLFYFSRKGGSKAADDVIHIFEKRDQEQKVEIARLQENYANIKEQIGRLQGTIEEKDKKLQEYILIFQGKDPDQKLFMKSTAETLARVATFMEKMEPVLNSLSKK